MNKSLRKAVLAQLGVSKKEFKENVSDYRDASAGITGFIYYNETHKFAMDNQQDIIELLEEQAEELGESIISMVESFGVFKGLMDKQDKKDLYNFLGGNKETEQGTVTNVLAWFCVEHLAFLYDN